MNTFNEKGEPDDLKVIFLMKSTFGGRYIIDYFENICVTVFNFLS